MEREPREPASAAADIAADEAAPEEARADAAADQVAEDDTPVSAPAEAAADELTATKRERDEYLELAQRTRADFDNYRKRVASEAAEAQARGKAELARQLLPVVDNLERALEAFTAQAAPGREAEEAALDSLAKGVQLVHEELRGKLEAAGVESYDPVGEPFDPELHEALSTRSEEGADSGRVLETVEKGYRLNGQVLRPARVVVSE